MRVVYIETYQRNDRPVLMMQMIGNVAPMHCTGNGKHLLLNYSEEEIDRLIEKEGLPRLTEFTICDKPSLMEELKKVKELGYSFDNEEYEIGVRCISFPIHGINNKVIAGLSISGPSSRMNDKFLFSKIDYCKEIVK